jgi:hypothetical protein
MKILLWHVHGGWTDAFVRGAHEYLLPTTPEGGAWGLGRAGRDWPEAVREVDPGSLRDADGDLVVLQRTEELAEAERLPCSSSTTPRARPCRTRCTRSPGATTCSSPT